MNTKRILKQYISTLKLYMTEEPSLLFRLRTFDETKNYLLDILHVSITCLFQIQQ